MANPRTAEEASSKVGAFIVVALPLMAQLPEVAGTMMMTGRKRRGRGRKKGS